MDLKCPKCGKSFNNKSEFMQHGKAEHGMNEAEIEMNMRVQMRGQMASGPAAKKEWNFFTP